MRTALLISFVMAVVLLASCEDMNGPGDIELVQLIGPGDTIPGTATNTVGAVRIKPPAFYRKWYNEAGKCIGLTGNFDAVKYYAVTLPWYGPRREVYIGQHAGSSLGQTILSSLHLGSEQTIKHEATHHHLALHGMVKANLAHDSTYFNTRCLTR
jgi:hypothetical protein